MNLCVNNQYRVRWVGLVGYLILIFSILAYAQNIPPNPKVVKSPLLAQPGKPGGQLTDASTRRPKTLNPMLEFNDLLQLLNSSLLEVNPITMEYEPALAESYEISADRKELRLILRQVRFSDGTPFTADDVLFTFNDILLNPSLQPAIQNAGLFLIPPPGLRIEKVNARTVLFKLLQGGVVNSNTLLFLLSQVKILPKHKLASKVGNPNLFVNAWSLQTNPNEFASLGPFKLFEVQADRIVMTKNPHYWKVDTNGSQLPYVEKFTRIFVANANEALERFQSGGLDLLVVRPSEAAILKDKFTLMVDGPSLSVNFLAFNQDIANPELRALFRDARFRKAVAHAINRENVLSRIGHQAPFLIARESFVHPLSPYFNEQATAKYEFNLAKASELLDQIGIRDRNGDGIRDFPSGKSVQFELITNQDNEVRKAFAQQVAANLAAIGVKVNYRAVPTDELNRRLNLQAQPPQASYEAVIISLTLEQAHSVDVGYLFVIFHSKGPFHVYRFSDATGDTLPATQKRIDEIFSHTMGVRTPSEDSKKLLEELQKLLSDDLPLIPLYSVRVVVALKNDIRNAQVINVLGPTPFIELLWRGS
jgi:peptide/nickel transport system substrate-binding protein